MYMYTSKLLYFFRGKSFILLLRSLWRANKLSRLMHMLWIFCTKIWKYLQYSSEVFLYAWHKVLLFIGISAVQGNDTLSSGHSSCLHLPQNYAANISGKDLLWVSCDHWRLFQVETLLHLNGLSWVFLYIMSKIKLCRKAVNVARIIHGLLRLYKWRPQIIWLLFE